MKSAVMVVPGNIDSRTGGFIYDRRMVDGLRTLGWSVDVLQLDESFPFPSPEARTGAAKSFARIPSGAVTIVDSLALGTIPEILEAESARLRLVGLMHLPLSADVGLDPEVVAKLAMTEHRALHAVKRVVVTGRAALTLLARYEVPPARIVVIEPGTDEAPLAVGSGGKPVQLLSVGTLNPGKGHEALLTALAQVPSRSWHLTCAGSLTRHAPTADRVRAAVSRLSLEDRVSLLGELGLPALEECYRRSDVFVLATARETYGMAVAEALAHGLPVVSTTTGAIPELVGDDAGVLVPPGDTQALAAALSRVITDSSFRARLAAGARRVRSTLPRWEHAVSAMAATLESVAHG